ncbi:MAG: tetratricopeptide repeat protein [Polyangiaceae bacterium]
MPSANTKSAILIESERQWRSGDLAKAGAGFREAVKRSPGDAAALVGLARAEFLRGEKKGAKDLIAQAERIAPRRADVMVTRGVFAEAARDGKRALETFREAARLDPRSAEARFNYGRILARARRLQEAEAELAAAAQLDQSNARIPFHQALAIGQDATRSAEAIRLLGRAIALDGRFVDAYCLLADVLERLGERAEAARILASAGRCVPGNRMILERHAALHQRRGELKRARDCMREVALLETGAKDFEVWRRLALIELATGDGAQAEACAGNAAKLAPKSAAVRFALGIIAETIGKKDAARTAYRKAIELDAKHWGAMTNLGRMLLNDRKPALAEALQLAERARALAPLEPAPALNLACALAAKGERVKAAEAAKAVLAMRGADKAMKDQARTLAGAAR